MLLHPEMASALVECGFYGRRIEQRGVFLMISRHLRGDKAVWKKADGSLFLLYILSTHVHALCILNNSRFNCSQKPGYLQSFVFGLDVK